MESPKHYDYDDDDDLLNDINLHQNEDLDRKTATLLHCVSHHSCLRLHTPLLEEVNIHAVPTGEGSNKPLTVGPEEILALLCHIDRRDTTLTRLAVSGAELATHVPVLLSQLFEVAESVTVDPEYIETVRVQGAPDFIGSP